MESRRDPYVVLGIPPQESFAGIRHAFRELAARQHPDRTVGRSAKRYEEVVEAYRTLAEPHPSAASTAEPRAVPNRRPGVLSLLRDFWAPRSALAETFERLMRNFTGRHVPKAETLRPLDLELVVSREDARSGGVVTLAVPTFRRCPVCSGAGRDASFVCFACGGQGLMEESEPVRLLIPAGVRNDTVFHLPLHGLGIGNLLLRVRVRTDV